MEPTLRIMVLIQSLTFENGKLHYREIEGLAAKFTPPFSNQVLAGVSTSCLKGQPSPAPLLTPPLPPGNVHGLDDQGLPGIVLW